MRGLDTNLLIRVLTKDDPDQCLAAVRLLREAELRGQPLYLNVIVLCELVWTLRGKRYRYSREEIAGALTTLVQGGVFLVQHYEQVKKAIDRYRRGPADFADYLIGHLNEQAGCKSTVTFDRQLASEAGFSALS